MQIPLIFHIFLFGLLTSLAIAGVSFRKAALSGAITAFIGIVAGAGAIYASACGNTLTDAVGLTKDTSTQDNLSSCLVAGAALAMSSWAGATIAIFGIGAGWFYDNVSTSARRKRDLPSRFRRLMNNVYVLHPEDSEPDVESLFDTYIQNNDHKLLGNAHVYTNVTGDMEHFGYIFHFQHQYGIHGVFTRDDSLDDALLTLNRFDGITYTPSPSINATHGDKFKRGNDAFWISFSGWGGNTGYEEDLLEWGEFGVFARSVWDIDERDMAPQIQACTQPQCYGLVSKFCSAIGFSGDIGKEDAIVGESYALAYGGLDNDCMAG